MRRKTITEGLREIRPACLAEDLLIKAAIAEIEDCPDTLAVLAKALAGTPGWEAEASAILKRHELD